METIWIVPPALGVFGVALVTAALLVSRSFDRRHPHLSRQGMRGREEAARSATRRRLIPIPPFRPEEWKMQAAREQTESDRPDRSLSRYGERVASQPKPAAETGSRPPR